MDAAALRRLAAMGLIACSTPPALAAQDGPAIEAAALATVVRGAAAPPLSGRALPNDNRTPAGRMVNGELRIELEAVEAEWYPRGETAAPVRTPVFAEVGSAPRVPGPFIRANAGTPIHVTIHNRLEHTIEIRGLLDRTPDMPLPPGSPPDAPAFLFAEPVVVPPGESRVARFTPTVQVSSFYFGRVIRADAAPGAPSFVPGGIADEGAFVGGLVVDPRHEAAPLGERVFVITRWGSPEEPGSLNPSWKMMINGQSWPHTERIALTVGDTAHWRIINTSLVDHPMHLHGFYFRVQGAGDTQTDTVFEAGTQREVVTELMQELSSLRITWVPQTPGNWLFHCHLIRHSGELQRFHEERLRDQDGSETPPAPMVAGGHGASPADMDMTGMAGMILGITVEPAGAAPGDPAPRRRIELWTGSRPEAFDSAPELGFVVQEGPHPPAPDSIAAGRSTLVLTRGEPTEIVVHNRLDIPLSVHWHGLELRSVHDGVGHWSGSGGSVRPPIAPGDSQHVLIEPPRAGTFFYHTHGEPGHELAQGLYGAFLVLNPGERRDPATDRLFVLGSRGASIDAPPAINTETAPGPQRFEAGRTYRLRFAHISPDEFKHVRLLRDGETVSWTARAKDGADLPPGRRIVQPASFGIGVGEAYDFEWTPRDEGVYVLEVRTSFYPSLGGSAVQRVAFGVGAVDDDELRIATQGANAATLSAAERRHYVGTFTGRILPVDDPREFIFAVWEDDGRLYSTLAPRGDADAEPAYMVPLGNHIFVPGTWQDGIITHMRDDIRIRFAGDSAIPDAVEVVQDGALVFRFGRVDALTLNADEMAALTGIYGGAGVPIDTHVSVVSGGLRLTAPGQPAWRLVPIAFDRFGVEGDDAPPGLQIVFELVEGRAAAMRVLLPGQPPIRLDRTGGG